MVLRDPVKEILGFEINLDHYFLDPLYGPVGLTDEELELVETQPFERLKRIKQLGFASNVYPGATHTRFEHSIGTLHTTWSIFRRFLKNYMQQPKWGSKRLLKYFSEDVVRSLRFAALVHDLGHGPFSHALENVARSFRIDFSHDKLSLYLLTFGISPRYTSKLLSQRLRKAIRSNKALSKTLQDYRREIAIIPKKQRMIAIAILDREYQSKSLLKGFLKIRHFLNSLISGDIGSDRIDYLLRDTFFTGLGHRFNFSDILEHLKGIYDRDKDRLLLSVDTNGRHAIEFLLTTRYYHYRLIAHHPRNMFEQMQFQKKLEEHLKKKNRTREFIDMALKEDSVEKKLPSSSVDFGEAGIWHLGGIRVDAYKYLFYRITEDPRLRSKYAKRIKVNICNGVRRFVDKKTSLSEHDLHVDFVVEKPHIPILQEYRIRYLIKKRLEEEKYSALIHDHSLLLFGLGRAYLSDTSMIIYANKANLNDVVTYTSKTHNFFVNSNIFKQTLKNTNLDRMVGHDLLLMALYKLTSKGRRHIRGISHFFGYIKAFQEKYCKTELYDLENHDCYDPEYKSAFIYPPELFNDLLLFDVSKLIWIQRKLENVTPARKKPLYTVVYHLIPLIAGPEVGLSGKAVTLQKALEHYPSDFRQKFDL